MKYKTNKWQIAFYVGRDFTSMMRGWYIFSFGILNMINLPAQGEMLKKHHYKGFLIRFYFLLPIERI